MYHVPSRNITVWVRSDAAYCNSSWYDTHHSTSSLGVFFFQGRLFLLGHQIHSFSLESSETGPQYASTFPYYQQTHHFWMAVWNDQTQMSHSDSQKVAIFCKSMAQCTLSLKEYNANYFTWRQACDACAPYRKVSVLLKIVVHFWYIKPTELNMFSTVK